MYSKLFGKRAARIVVYYSSILYAMYMPVTADVLTRIRVYV